MPAGAVQRPLYDAVHPSQADLAASLPEHLLWDELSEAAQQTLFEPDASVPVHAAVATTVANNFKSEYHVMERRIGFARCALPAV